MGGAVKCLTSGRSLRKGGEWLTPGPSPSSANVLFCFVLFFYFLFFFLAIRLMVVVLSESGFYVYFMLKLE